MNTLPRNYDAWRLSGPEDYRSDVVGTEYGDPCNRYHVPDEDAPRGYRPRPCGGLMMEQDGEIVCDTCGEAA